MKITLELMAKAKETKSVEELLALAKDKGIELTAEEAEAYYTKLHPAVGELSDEELDNVSGGCGGNSDERDGYLMGDHVLFWYSRKDNLLFEGTIVDGCSLSSGTEFYIEYYQDYLRCWTWCRKEDIVKWLYR